MGYLRSHVVHEQKRRRYLRIVKPCETVAVARWPEKERRCQNHARHVAAKRPCAVCGGDRAAAGPDKVHGNVRETLLHVRDNRRNIRCMFVAQTKCVVHTTVLIRWRIHYNCREAAVTKQSA